MSIFASIDNNNHEQVVYCQDVSAGLRAIIAIHNTVLGPSIGGVRMWNYENEYRILTIGKYSDPLFIDIKDAIEEIIFGDQVSNLAIPEDKIFKKYPSVKLYKLVYEYAYNRINRVPIMPKAAGNWKKFSHMWPIRPKMTYGQGKIIL